MTTTTKSRINAFISGLSGACGAGIYQKNYELYFSSKKEHYIHKIDSEKWYEIENDSTIQEVENISDFI